MVKPFGIDILQVEKKLNLVIDKVIPEAIERGLGKAAMQLMADAILELPGTPMGAKPVDQHPGMLRDSASVFVQNRLIQVSEGFETPGTPALDHQEEIPADQIVAVVGFNTPYAAYQHEGGDGIRVVRNYTTPGTGKKFLELKLQQNDQLYAEIVANEVKAAGGNA